MICGDAALCHRDLFTFEVSGERLVLSTEKHSGNLHNVKGPTLTRKRSALFLTSPLCFCLSHLFLRSGLAVLKPSSQEALTPKSMCGGCKQHTHFISHIQDNRTTDSVHCCKFSLFCISISIMTVQACLILNLCKKLISKQG